MPPFIAPSTMNQRGFQSVDANVSATVPTTENTTQKWDTTTRTRSTDNAAVATNDNANQSNKQARDNSDHAVVSNGAASEIYPQQQQQQQQPLSGTPAGYGLGNVMYSDPSLYGGYGSAGGFGSPYGYGSTMMTPPMGGSFLGPSFGGVGGGPLSNLNQFLFSVQSVIFSLGQAVQIIGMNTQALKQLLESVSSMVDHAIASWNEMQALEATRRDEETEEMKKKRRRLRAFRMALVAAVSYLGYRVVRWMLSSSRRRSLTPYPHPHPQQLQQQPPSYNYNTTDSTGYYRGLQ